MMKIDEKIEICEHCGAKMYKYWHRLNKPLCRALFKMYEIGKPANIANIGLTHNQICNFQKLKYWGFVEKHGSGEWMITENGKEFCKNNIQVSARIQTYRGKVIEHSKNSISIKQVLIDEWLKIENYIKERECFHKDSDNQIRMFQGERNDR